MGKEKIRVAIIGFGGMGHFHASCYQGQEFAELVAVCDGDAEKFQQRSADINLGNSGDSDLSGLVCCSTYEELKEKVEFDAVDICLPGHLHAEYAIRAMKDGYHVLCEKPMARNLAEAKEMIACSRETGKKLMIAQCLRFFKSYRFFRDLCLGNRDLGTLLSVHLSRKSSMPASSWYHDAKKSGGALLDLHLHDTDFVNYTFGLPQAVFTTGITRNTGGLDDLTTTYIYDGGPVITAAASWCNAKWDCFAEAVFEKACVRMQDDIVKIFPRSGEMQEYDFTGEKNGYYLEIDAFFRAVAEDKNVPECLIESTCDSIMITEMEEKSAISRKIISIE